MISVETSSQGMLNTPTLCLYIMQQLPEIIWRQFLEIIIYHYMDDIFMADSDADTLEKILW